MVLGAIVLSNAAAREAAQFIARFRRRAAWFASHVLVYSKQTFDPPPRCFPFVVVVFIVATFVVAQVLLRRSLDESPSSGKPPSSRFNATDSTPVVWSRLPINFTRPPPPTWNPPPSQAPHRRVIVALCGGVRHHSINDKLYGISSIYNCHSWPTGRYRPWCRKCAFRPFFGRYSSIAPGSRVDISMARMRFVGVASDTFAISLIIWPQSAKNGRL